ncbi:hypothetical protein LNI96_01035 [Tenacibaculum dicentrarchi]|nr:hypothetical protein [Tenacibaculum dicentrarchi]
MTEEEIKKYNELINQVVISARRDVTKKSIKKFVESTKDKIDKEAKNQFIKKVQEAEIFAKKTKNFTIEQDLFQLKNKMINDNHYTLLLNEYHTNNIKSYDNIKNLYKVSKEQFYYLHSKTKKELTDNDRFDFIATILLGYLDWKPDSDNYLKESKEVFKQIKDIDNIVYETYLAELKNEYSKKYLNEVNHSATKKEPQQEKKELQLNEILTCEPVEAEKIVNGIKIKYKNIKGKQLKLLFLALQNLDLIPKEQFAKKFHNCCIKEFNWDVASYNAMNGSNPKSKEDFKELNAKTDYLKTFINS